MSAWQTVQRKRGGSRQEWVACTRCRSKSWVWKSAIERGTHTSCLGCGNNWAEMAQKTPVVGQAWANTMEKSAAKTGGTSGASSGEESAPYELQSYLSDRHLFLRQQSKARGGLVAIQQTMWKMWAEGSTLSIQQMLDLAEESLSKSGTSEPSQRDEAVFKAVEKEWRALDNKAILAKQNAERLRAKSEKLAKELDELKQQILEAEVDKEAKRVAADAAWLRVNTLHEQRRLDSSNTSSSQVDGTDTRAPDDDLEDLEMFAADGADDGLEEHAKAQVAAQKAECAAAAAKHKAFEQEQRQRKEAADRELKAVHSRFAVELQAQTAKRRKVPGGHVQGPAASAEADLHDVVEGVKQAQAMQELLKPLGGLEQQAAAFKDVLAKVISSSAQRATSRG